jgi:phosphate/phosphite/phosphonate ABC transporter binding protein
VPDLEPELARIVLCALARNKSTRFESAEAFDAALRERVPSAETATASSNTKPTKPSTKVGRPLRAKGDHASTALPASVPADAAHATSRTTSSGPSSSQPAGITHPIRGGTLVPRPASSRNATLGGSILAVIAFVGAGYGLFQQSRAADASDEAANGVPANGIAANVTPLHYGVVRYLPTDEVEGTHRRLVEYLSQGIDHPIELRVVEDYTNLGEALASGALDLAVLSANAYVVARDAHPELELVATAVGVAGPFYEGYIVVNAASDIDTLEGLRGHSFCYVSTTSSSGYVYPRALLRQAGVDPDEAFTTTRLTGDHLASLRALHAGACDGAAVFGSILFRAGEFDLSPSMFRVLARTERIPYDAYVLGPHLSEARRDSLRRALLALEPGSELAQRTFPDPHTDLRGLREASDAQFDEVRALRSFVESD